MSEAVTIRKVALAAFLAGIAQSAFEADKWQLTRKRKVVAEYAFSSELLGQRRAAHAQQKQVQARMTGENSSQKSLIAQMNGYIADYSSLAHLRPICEAGLGEVWVILPMCFALPGVYTPVQVDGTHSKASR